MIVTVRDFGRAWARLWTRLHGFNTKPGHGMGPRSAGDVEAHGRMWAPRGTWGAAFVLHCDERDESMPKARSPIQPHDG